MSIVIGRNICQLCDTTVPPHMPEYYGHIQPNNPPNLPYNINLHKNIKTD